MKTIPRRSPYWFLLLPWLGQALPAAALQALEDETLSAITGQDGVTATLQVPSAGITVTSQELCFDQGGPGSCVAGADPNASSLMLRNLSLSRIGNDGAAAPGAFNIVTQLDIGAASVSGLPGVRLRTDWERMRLRVGDPAKASEGGLVLGDVANAANISTLNQVFDASGHLEVRGYNGLFNVNETLSGISLGINDGLVGVRTGMAAGSPELILNNFNFLWRMPQGRVGICGGNELSGPCDDSSVGKSVTNGLLLMGDTTFALNFDLLFDRAPSTAFAVDATDKALFNFGWSGTLTNAMFRMGGGGAWDEGAVNGCYSGSAAVACSTTDITQRYNRPQNPDLNAPVASTTQGVSIGMHWSYSNDFEWTVGDVASTTNPVTLKFGKWVNLPSTTTQPTGWAAPGQYAFSLPLLALDMVNSGHGPGGLCWGANWEGPRGACEASGHGGQFVNVQPENDTLAVMIRDGFIRAYSTDVTILDPNASSPANQVRKMGWALVYTVGNFDANFLLRPETRVNLTGLKLSGVAMTQTFDAFDKAGIGNKPNGNIFEWGPNWEYGSHFMIADTDPGVNMGIGVLNNSFMLAVKNANFDYLPQGARPGTTSDIRPGGISLGDPYLLDATKAQTNSPVRFGLYGRFGGGDLPNMSRQVNVMDMKFNMEMDRFHLMLYSQQDLAAGTQPYLGFEATMHFTRLTDADFSDAASSNPALGAPGSYYWLGEPGRPEASVRFAKYTGWMAYRNGTIHLNSDADTPTNVASQLEIKQDILWGKSVSNSMTGTTSLPSGSQVGMNEMVLGDIGLAKLAAGNSIAYDSLGTMVLPAGQWYSRIALQPKH